jgi:TP901 family phage tail tape measure protein
VADKIEIVVTATDKASGVFKKLGNSIGGIGKLAAGAAVGGVAALGAAVGVTAVKGLQAFTNFERGMNEVFTLLPGISGAAMDDMQKQVLDLSKEFGVLPEEVVPALYQSLSAGVPPSNVFEFMETATMASKGGITELSTAVDGITSVVNAYGAETIDAGRASDVMFTAVRLGKTTMDELSTSVFQATPLAAALGVSFEEVAGATASLTKQGVPTSVAMTQVRQAMVALQKPNKDMVGLLEAAGFASGQAALDSADFASVLDILRNTSDETGLSMETAFGSVEAIGAVLALTGDNAAGAAADLLAMQESAGATGAAFDQMQQGIGPVIDRFRAWKDAMLITIGDALAPLAAAILDMVEDKMPAIEAGIEMVLGALTFLFDAISSGADVFVVFEDGSSVLSSFLEKLGLSEEQARGFADMLIGVRDGLSSVTE